MSILRLIASRNFISVNKNLIRCIGLEEAVLVGELASELHYLRERTAVDDEFICLTVEEVKSNTGLTGYQQRKILNRLSELGIIEATSRGIPAKRHIRINENVLLNVLNRDKQAKESIEEDFTFGEEAVKTENSKRGEATDTVFSFESFWNAYGKKCEKAKCEKLYAKIPESERKIIKERIGMYVSATPDRAYRKNPATYLRNQCWNDDIIKPRQSGKTTMIDRTLKGF